MDPRTQKRHVRQGTGTGMLTGNESGAPSVDRQPMLTSVTRSRSGLSTASTRSSTSWSEPEHLEDGCDGGRALHAAAHHAATATGVCADARAGSDATSGPAPLEQAEAPQVDTRPVRGVATLQTRPSVTGPGKPMRVLLVASRDAFSVQTLEKPYRRLLETPLRQLVAQAVPDHDNMFRIWIYGLRDAGDEGIVAVLRDCLLRDQWLQALVTAGARVDVAGWHPEAGTTMTMPPECLSHGFCLGVPPPVRWLR